jgi:lambda family phage minor tail protein L
MAYAAWTASTAYSVGDVVRATTLQSTGLVFQCTVAGTSDAAEPSWPPDIGSTIADGGVTWAAISSVYADVSILAPNAIIELFELELDATLHGASTIYYWHAGTNENVTGNIIYGGNTYVRLPVEATGFDYTSSGTLPRPTLRVANLMGDVTALLLLVNATTAGNDLGGAIVRRIRTLKKFLDGEPGADPDARFPTEVWYVDRKSNENRDVVEFELASKLDLAGQMIPRRQVIANVCQWKYRGAECGYTGPPVADVVGQPIAPDSSAEAIAYAAAEATVESTKAALDAATTDLNAATNALNVAEGTWTLSSSQYNRDLNLGTPDYYVAVRQSSGDLYLVLWNNGTVQLGNQYRRGNLETTASIGRGTFNVIDYYRIEEWTFDTSAVTAAQSAYNAALSAYTTAETNYTNALSSRDAALATWQASVTYAAELAGSGDICGKRISDCRLRFGAEAELPFGSFPGAGLTQ